MSAQQLNEWNLPHGTEPHNPDGLTPEQITEGGKYRALAKCEVDGRHRGRGYLEYWDGKKWCSGGFGSEPSTTYRVPITTPLPAVKESLTSQPATGQSKTPRTDAWIFKTRSEYGPNGPENFTESTSYSRKLETKLTTAQRKLDEAHGLLERAIETVQDTLTLLQHADFSHGVTDSCGADEGNYIADKYETRIKETLTAINQHLAL